ncbi:hypothetical protein Dsin_008647 [Dipteronia sinensis]|uniref:RNase H type-1 domain-containing protein n=1 Tax=Dipteronia sinensis TaxID=43782 RepID=A0AAE0AQB3_9ROSI|nr:hypothetical protein Dsin_008647 [Dipteronia sinensis]
MCRGLTAILTGEMFRRSYAYHSGVAQPRMMWVGTLMRGVCTRSRVVIVLGRSWRVLRVSPIILQGGALSLTVKDVRPILNVVLWQPPNQGWYKINCKAVIDGRGGGIGLGIIIRDGSGLVMASYALQIATGVNIWAANALAILKSIQFGNECGLSLFSIESDAKRVVNWIKNSNHLSSNYGSILGDIDRISSQLRGSKVNWVPAVCNLVALGLAKEALILDVDNFWMDDFHQCVERQVSDELQ